MHSTVERLHNTNIFEVKLEKVYHIRTGCWKQEYKEGGWSVEKGFSPSEIGGYWVELKACRRIEDKRKTTEFKTRIYPT
jgi:hypothetical protein